MLDLNRMLIRCLFARVCVASCSWGLVTYRETALLVNPQGIEAMTEQNVVTTVAHELAHQ